MMNDSAKSTIGTIALLANLLRWPKALSLSLLGIVLCYEASAASRRARHLIEFCPLLSPRGIIDRADMRQRDYNQRV